MTKTCNKCKMNKPIDDFSINKRNKTDGRQPKCKACNSQYYAERSESINKRVSEHYHNNHERILIERVELRKRPDAKAKKAEQDRKYYLLNKSQVQKRYRQWAKENREWLSAYHSAWEPKRRFLIEKNGNNSLTKAEVRELFMSHPYCEYCGSVENLSLDHIIPITRGGQHCLENVTVACMTCNTSKNNKLLSEWKNGSS